MNEKQNYCRDRNNSAWDKQIMQREELKETGKNIQKKSL